MAADDIIMGSPASTQGDQRSDEVRNMEFYYQMGDLFGQKWTTYGGGAINKIYMCVGTIKLQAKQ